MGLFNLFGKKEHREKYKAQEEKVNRAIEKLGKTKWEIHRRETVKSPFDRKPHINYYEGWPTLGHLDGFERDLRKAYKKLDRLYEEGRDEAIELHDKYVGMIARLGKDAKADYDFERDKLGMHKHDSIKKNVGTVVGAISIISLVFASLYSMDITGNVIGNAGVLQGSALLLAISLIFGLTWLIIRR